MSSRFEKGEKAVMVIFGIKKVTVLVKIFFKNERGIRKMEPWLADEDK